jgi:hypothetical protein
MVSRVSRGLVAGISATGALILLTSSSGAARAPGPLPVTPHEPLAALPQRVDQMLEKLRSAAPAQAGEPRVAQYWNFFNCFRPGWRNC